MQTRGRLGIAAITLVLLGLMLSPSRSWGEDRFGTVLLVDGIAEVRAPNADAWRQLRFRDAIFLNDTVRTEAQSRLKLLRDESIWTLDERGQMQFTEAAKPWCKPRGPTPQTTPQSRPVAQLLLGKLRGLTSLVFGSDAVAEVRTPNAVMCMYGTEFIVIFTPPDTSEFIGLDGLITVQHINLAIPEIEPVPPNFRTRVERQAPPDTAVEITPEEAEVLTQGLGVIEQAPEQDVIVVPDTDVPPVVETAEETEGTEGTTYGIATGTTTETITTDTSPTSQEVIRSSIIEFMFEFPR